MPAPRKLPDERTLMQHRREGWTLEQIAAHYGVTKGAVYLALKPIPGAVNPRARNADIIPWRVRREHAHERPVEYLRLAARLEKGEKIPEDKLRRLNRWLDEVAVASVVVDYDPDFPPNPASPRTGGWHYRRRTPADGPFDREDPRTLIRRPTGDLPEQDDKSGKGDHRADDAQTARLTA